MSWLGSFRSRSILRRLEVGDAAGIHAAGARLGKLDAAAVVTALTPRVDDPDPEVRVAAVEVLAKVESERASERLLEAIVDPDRSVRAAAAVGLARVGLPATMGRLTVTLAQNPQAQLHATEAIALLLPLDGAPDLLAAFLGSGYSTLDVRQVLVRALGVTGEARAVGALVAALEPNDSEVRAAAAAELGRFDGNEVMEPLLECLTTRDPDLPDNPGFSDSVISALSALEDPRVADRLIGMIPQANAIKALVLLGHPRAAAALRSGMADVFSEAYPASSRIKAIAAALIDLGEAHATAIGLVELLRSDQGPAVRFAAAVALGSLGDSHAVEPLIEILRSDEDSKVRSAAAIALGSLGDSRAVEQLIEQLDRAPSSGELQLLNAWVGGFSKWQDNWETAHELDVSLFFRPRDGAALALGRIGEERAIGALIEYFDRREGEVSNTGVVTDTAVMDRERTVWHIGDLAAATFAAIGEPARAPLLARADGGPGTRNHWWIFDAIASVADTQTKTSLRRLMDEHKHGSVRWGRIHSIIDSAP